ncbi:uncharacterized protein BDZ99DRAFT_558431 [Mytilinidion resinicola]|uniref:Flo11 n=1 Tax=Mytilinidion resinicola TaxID=574789 RepID=A0A6A6YV79_9PEZI|nr:uncharacterized protein BDZ99DRAFT_558431 [Mytilinidion resinicola]KAF2812448.1 hypothetical protein BDZ99DRAFT_558431 [Mytilinidion resinicola]
MQMHRHTRSDAGELGSPRSSRAASFSSDRPSLAGSTSFQIPSNVRPAPAYIAASVASQLVSDHQNAKLRAEFDLEDDSPYLTNALFSEEALCLLNAFLDHLLFSFLAAARSPSLTAIRPAISDVLKPRLAREAMATADEELQGLLAGEDDDEFPALQNGQDPSEKWDVETVWKRTRLRIMVYTRLGELEDEDEERYVQQERGLSLNNGSNDELGLVSWAAAIFLTSVVEYIAEQTLMVSGQAAFSRASAKMKKDEDESPLERIVVEDFDVEKVALNSTLGRLWRTWRKRVRAPIVPLGSSVGRGSVGRSGSKIVHHVRGNSDELSQDPERSRSLGEVPEHEVTETDIAANIPLPITSNDVAEIEVPGLARQFDDEESGAETPTVATSRRPSSFILLPSSTTAGDDDVFVSRSGKRRPFSMPPPERGAFTFPAPSLSDDAYETPMERMSRESYMETSDNHEGDEDNSKLIDEHHGEHDVSNSGVLSGAIAGAAAMATAAVASVTGTRSYDDEDDAETPGVSDVEPVVMQGKRMSISSSGPPGIVRTFSTRSNRSSVATPLATPIAETHKTSITPTSELEEDDRNAIGVARTSDVPVSSTPDLQNEPITNGASALPGGANDYKEQPSRRLSVSPPISRKTPSPTERTVQSKAPPPRSSSTSSRNPPLAALQEATNWIDMPDKSVQNGSAVRSQEKSAKRQSNDSSRDGNRSRSGTAEGYPTDRVTVQRVSSSSSRSPSLTTSILHSAKGSESSLGRARGLSQRLSEEDRQREFDSLVMGEETVKYTLTPQSMRDLDESPLTKTVEAPKPPAKSPTQVTVYPRVDAGQSSAFGAQARSPVKGKSTASVDRYYTTQNSRPSSTSTSRSKTSQLAAREPRIQTESMRDFADFIRSTGPHESSSRSSQPIAASQKSSSPISGLGRKISGRSGPAVPAKHERGDGASSVRSKLHMEPRSPAGQGNGNTDLIDFIRQGPPAAAGGEHRIPRTVAPFRSTVDSDEFSRMLNDRSPDNSHVDSSFGSQVSTTSKQSTLASTNSRTGLLATPNVVQPAYSDTPQFLAGSQSNPEPQVVRKRRRVKDPYAIDTDDEDEDLLTALPKSGRREESLIDFLRNTEPPTQNEPKPIIPPGAIAAAAKNRPNGSSQASSSRNGATSAAAAGSRAAPPIIYRPGVGSGAGLSTSNNPAMMTGGSGTGSVPRSNKPRLQARVATARDATTSRRSEVNDLADFLRTSGPPDPVNPPPSAATKKENRLPSARFWRKKTYAE